MITRYALKSSAAAGRELAAGSRAPARAARAAGPGAVEASRGPFIETADGTQLFCKDWGAGKPVLFLHSWSVNADMWH